MLSRWEVQSCWMVGGEGVEQVLAVSLPYPRVGINTLESPGRGSVGPTPFHTGFCLLRAAKSTFLEVFPLPSEHSRHLCSTSTETLETNFLLSNQVVFAHA